MNEDLRLRVLNKLAKEDKVDTWKEWKKASILFGENATVKKIESAVDLAFEAKDKQTKKEIDKLDDEYVAKIDNSIEDKSIICEKWVWKRQALNDLLDKLKQKRLSLACQKAKGDDRNELFKTKNI